MQHLCRVLDFFWASITVEMHGNAGQFGWAPSLGARSAGGPTEAEMPAGQMFNRLIVHSLLTSQPIISDTNMFAVAASGAWYLSQMMEMRRKFGLVS